MTRTAELTRGTSSEASKVVFKEDATEAKKSSTGRLPPKQVAP